MISLILCKSELEIAKNHTSEEEFTMCGYNKDDPTASISALEKKLRDIVEELAASLCADVITLWVYDSEVDELDLPVGYGLKEPEALTDPGLHPTMDGKAGRIVRYKQSMVPIEMPEPSILGNSFALREGICASSGFPLLDQDQVWGLLFVSFRTQHNFTEQEKSIIEKKAQEAADAILQASIQANIFSELRRRRRGSSPLEGEKILSNIAKLASRTLDRPVAIWLQEPQSNALRVSAIAALHQAYLREGIAHQDDGSLVSQVIETKQKYTISKLDYNLHLPYLDYALKAGWSAACGFPIRLEGKVVGVIEVFCPQKEDIDTIDQNALWRLADTIEVVVERAEYLKQLRTAIFGFGTAINLNEAMEFLVESACKLTRADSSTITLYQEESEEFSIAARFPPGETQTIPKPRTHGLARKIIDTGNPILISNTEVEDGVKQELREAGIRSLAGVKIKGGFVGALLVRSRKIGQFSKADLETLKTLAALLSGGMSGTHWFLGTSSKIEQATERLFELQPVLDDCCKEIQNLGYDFSAIQLIQHEEHTIETVSAVGIQKELAGLAKHQLFGKQGLLDIQSEIATNENKPKIEVTGGWDDRFDRWIYDTYHHEKLVRLWIPLLLVHNKDGTINKNWFSNCQLVEITDQSPRENGWHQAWIIQFSKKPLIEIIGTVEAGFVDPQAKISFEKVKKLFQYVSGIVPNIYRYLLPYVLETITKQAIKIIGANAGSLHFSFDNYRKRYLYEVYYGKEDFNFLQKSRSIGYEYTGSKHYQLLQDAIKSNKPQIIFNITDDKDDLHEFSKLGIGSVGVFPLIVKHKKGDKDGGLYLYFREPRQHEETELNWVKHFVDWAAVNPIYHASQLLQSQNQTRRLTHLHEFTRSLVQEFSASDLLRRIAGNTQNILAADVVAVHKYMEKLSSSEIAGKCQRREEEEIKKYGYSLYKELVDKPKPIIYISENNNNNHKILEGFQSAAVAQLLVGEETVGLICIYYRLPHIFEQEEQNIISIIASSAAIAIKTAHSYQQNINELDILRKVDRAIIDKAPALREVLPLILEQAVNVTQAAIGYIMSYDRYQETLNFEATIPIYSFDLFQGHKKIKIEKGIEVEIVKGKEPIIIPDVDSETFSKGFIPFSPKTRSLLLMPLYDDHEKNLWGVLGLEHRQPGFFKDSNLVLMQTLAVQAIIVVHSVDLYDRLKKQINPLRSLRIIAPRIQDTRNDLDTVLHLLLTGVTAEQGLGFSRALLFYYDEEKKILKGKMAIGAMNQKLADEVWGDFEKQKREHNNNPDELLIKTLDHAKNFIIEVKDGKLDDYPLSKAIQSIEISTESNESVLVSCLRESKEEIVPALKPDPFRDYLEKATLDSSKNFAFACVPLVGEEGRKLGVLVVDNRFLFTEKIINLQDTESLMVYAKIAAMSIDLAERQRREIWDSLTRQVAHNINNRISTIESEVTHLEGILKSYNQEPTYNGYKESMEECMSALKKAIATAKRIIQDYRISSAPMDLNIKELDLVKVIQSALEQERPLIEEVRCKIERDFCSKLKIRIRGDELKLVNCVFSELIINACQAMRDEGISPPRLKIDIHTDVSNEFKTPFARIDFANPGKGIPENLKERIFDEYYTTKGSRGSGLGLSIMRKCLKAHKGSIKEVGEPGRETCFMLQFPMI